MVIKHKPGFEGIADAEALVRRAEQKIAALRTEAEMLMVHCQRLRVCLGPWNSPAPPALLLLFWGPPASHMCSECTHFCWRELSSTSSRFFLYAATLAHVFQPQN